MKVKVRRFMDAAYHAALDICNEEVYIKDFWEEFTGEVVGADVKSYTLLICRDDNSKFDRVSCNDCFKID